MLIFQGVPIADPWNNGIFIYMNPVDFYGFHVGKYTMIMDPSWDIFEVVPLWNPFQTRHYLTAPKGFGHI